MEMEERTSFLRVLWYFVISVCMHIEMSLPGLYIAGSKANNTLIINDMDFMSTLVTEDEYNVSKTPSSLKDTGCSKLGEPEENISKKGVDNQFTLLETSYTPKRNDLDRKSKQSQGESSKIDTIDELAIEEVPSTSLSSQYGLHLSSEKAEKESQVDKTGKLTEAALKSSLKPSREKKFSRSVTWADEKTNGAGGRNLCDVREIEDMKDAPSLLSKMNNLSLEPSGAMKAGNSVSWPDKKGYSSRRINVCEFREIKDTEEASDMLLGSKDTREDDDMLRFASAEACVKALSEASEAVTSGDLEVSDAGTLLYAFGLLFVV